MEGKATKQLHGIEVGDRSSSPYPDGSRNPHQISRAIFGKDRGDLLDHGEHHHLRLADRKPADRVAVKADLDQALRARTAQFGDSSVDRYA
jgi:hypothetical protein